MARAAPLSFRPAQPPVTGKGRGARSNRSGRYEQAERTEEPDGWSEDAPPPLATTTLAETPRRIITFNQSPYVGFDRSINPYRGCEHGCIYCFARPTHAWMGLSAGTDFETKLFIKPAAAKLLRHELSHPKYRVRPIAIGTNTDPYQPVERHHLIMRQVLQVLAEFNHPVSILTKSALILRDLEILAPMAKKGLARCMLSITTEDRKLARAMEPRASTPEKRFEALRQLSAAGIPCGVVTGPVIPGLNDSEFESLIEKSAASGALTADYTLLRLPLEVAPLFQEWLADFAPGRADRIMRHIRDMNGGRDYDPEWSRAAQPKGVFARLMAQRYRNIVKKTGLAGGRKMLPLDCSQFRVPATATGQGDLFT